MTAAQIVFAVALASVTLVVIAFAAYVIASTAWGDRWTRR